MKTIKPNQFILIPVKIFMLFKWKKNLLVILTFFYWEWKFQLCQKCHLYSWIFRHVSLSQKWNFRACGSTEKVKEAQRCGVTVVIKYKCGSWKGGWRKIWLCGCLEKMYQNRLFISSASERMKRTVGGIKVDKRYCFACKGQITLHVEAPNIYWATGQTPCQAQGTEVLPLVWEAPGLWMPGAKGQYPSVSLSGPPLAVWSS